MPPKPKPSAITPPLSKTDPSLYIWGQDAHPLEVIFKPKSIAVIGATEKPGSVGRTIISNLLGQPFGGTVYPVNPSRKSVLGVRAYPHVGALPEKVDLAVIVTPAATVPSVVEECAKSKVKGAIIISAGFKELGAPGEKLEAEVLQISKKSKMRIIGPNCLGVMNPITGMNATFANRGAKPGSVAFISQSGALCTSILDWSAREHVGFSAFVSIGSMLDIGWGDLIDYLGDDPNTKSILMYMETIGDARSFLAAAREVALTKPIIVLKAGRTNQAAKAAASHTGSIAGSDQALDAAFRRSGVLRVDRIEELFEMAELLAKQPRPRGKRLSIVTNAGGPGVLTTDALISDGGELAELSKSSLDQLNGILPEHWSHANPIDILGDAGPELYAKSVEVVSGDPQSDGLLVILTPQAMTDPERTAEFMKPYAKLPDRPILASWMGGKEVGKGRDILHRAGIPVFSYPEQAARLFNYMWKYNENLSALYETPSLAAEDARVAQSRKNDCEKRLGAVRRSGRSILTEEESKQILSAYGIPVVETFIADSAKKAVAFAEKTGYPAVLKLYSKTVTHKTDVGGVKLNLSDAAAVEQAYGEIEVSMRSRGLEKDFEGVTVQKMITRRGYELIIGSSLDAQLGPVILFGSGGQFVEIMKDYALGLVPLNTTLARRLAEQTKVFQLLKGARGLPPVDLAQLDALLVSFSRLVIEQPLIKEIDINPLLASAEGFIALDARVILHEASITLESVPKPPIRPYPDEYIFNWTSKQKQSVLLRPIRPEDEPLMIEFHRSLSEQSVRRRWFTSIGLNQRVAHERLIRVCFHNYDREIALAAEIKDAQGEVRIVGAGRLIRLDAESAEFAMVISDSFQNQGLGTELLKRLIQVARQEGFTRILAEMLPDNLPMQHLCRKLGFDIHPDAESQTAHAALKL